MHLIRFPATRAPAAVARTVGLEGSALRRTPGLRFFRSLLTTDPWTLPFPKWTLSRVALLAAWEDEQPLDAFLAESNVAARWRERGREAYHVRMTPVRANGSWGGVQPFAPLARADPDAPAAVLTYGRIRARHAGPFWMANRRIMGELGRQPALLAYVGLGDKPATTATFSVWRTLADATGFAYRGDSHPPVVPRSRERHWHRETLFARFQPYAASGAWNGRDPLGAAVD